MSKPSSPTLRRARWLFPIDAPPVDGGWVEVHEGRVVAFGGGAPPGPCLDLGDVALLPGLVNPHVHLEFSSLAAPLRPASGAFSFGESAARSSGPGDAPTRGGSWGESAAPPNGPGTDPKKATFPDWIAAVVAWRRSLPADYSPAAAIQAGLAEAKSSGTALAGEIASCDWRADDPAHPLGDDAAPAVRPELLVFREAIALSPERAAQALATAEAHLNAPFQAGPVPRRRAVRRGISPHAPYTVRFELVQDLARLAGKYAAPAAMHLAESPEELELLRTGGGPFRDLLEQFGVWRADAFATPRTILDYLEALQAAPQALVIHGNFLQPAEIAFLAAERTRCTLVYCPRTHAAFGWPTHPLSKVLAAGGSVALGTDGRSSNPDLDLWAELRFAAARHPEIAPARWLEMVTKTPAAGLGAEADFGAIRVGARARFATAEMPPENGADPYAALLAAPALRLLWLDDANPS